MITFLRSNNNNNDCLYMYTCMQRTPFHNAAFYGQADLALYLLEKGAKVSGWVFQEILSEGYE